jgi:hypothetical protein
MLKINLTSFYLAESAGEYTEFLYNTVGSKLFFASPLGEGSIWHECILRYGSLFYLYFYGTPFEFAEVMVGMYDIHCRYEFEIPQLDSDTLSELSKNFVRDNIPLAMSGILNDYDPIVLADKAINLNRGFVLASDILKYADMCIAKDGGFTEHILNLVGSNLFFASPLGKDIIWNQCIFRYGSLFYLYFYGTPFEFAEVMVGMYDTHCRYEFEIPQLDNDTLMKLVNIFVRDNIPLTMSAIFNLD